MIDKARLQHSKFGQYLKVTNDDEFSVVFHVLDGHSQFAALQEIITLFNQRSFRYNVEEIKFVDKKSRRVYVKGTVND